MTTLMHFVVVIGSWVVSGVVLTITGRDPQQAWLISCLFGTALNALFSTQKEQRPLSLLLGIVFLFFLCGITNMVFTA